MKWIKIKVITTNEAIEPVSVILDKFGGDGVEIDDSIDIAEGLPSELAPELHDSKEVSVTAWIPEDKDPNFEEIKKEIESLKEFGIDPGEVRLYISFEDDENWNEKWKEQYKPIPVASNMIIVPIWDRDKFKDDERIVIFIDPGMAFGTGDHPTTILTLQALLLAYKHGVKVFDVGSGSGILSIAAVKLGATSVKAMDIDTTTLINAATNFENNGVSDQIDLSEGNLLAGVTGKADLILANILAEIHLLLIDQLDEHLAEDGTIVLGGIIKNKEDIVVDKLSAHGFTVRESLSMGDWITLIVERTVD